MTQAAILAASGSPGTTTGFKNRIINGNMNIDQRNAGASVTIGGGSGTYTLDRWQAWASAGSKYTVQQNAGSVTPPVGFTNYLGITSSAATTVGASDYYTITQPIEGYNIADLGFGTANAKTVTISFWARSSLTGTFGACLRNGDGSRSYPFTYTISSANTWTQASVTINGDTTGTWPSNNSAGMFLWLGFGVGSNYTGATGSWQSANYLSANGSVNVVSTSGATFYITGCQLEVGTTATNFDFRSYGTELQLCQRYFAKLGGTVQYDNLGTGNLSDSSTAGYYCIKYPVTMRSAPTATISSLYVSDNATYNLSVSSIRGQTNGLNTTNLGLNTSSSGTTFAATAVITQNSSGYIAFSAEL